MTSANRRQVRLTWAGEGLRFGSETEDGRALLVDGDAQEGLAPMELLLASLAGCMAIDVRVILERSRVRIDDLEVEAIGIRADEPPRRYLSIELLYRIGGPGEEDRAKVERAVELSRVKYCSVLHTLDPELALDVRIERG